MFFFILASTNNRQLIAYYIFDVLPGFFSANYYIHRQYFENWRCEERVSCLVSGPATAAVTLCNALPLRPAPRRQLLSGVRV